MRRDNIVFARISISAAIVSLLLMTLLHALKTDLEPAGHMLSEYAIGEYGWVMQLSFDLWALSCYALGVSIRSQVVTRSGRVGVMLLYVAGCALILGAVFVIDSPYATPVTPTAHGSLHGLSAMIGLPGQAIAGLLISYSLRLNPGWNNEWKLVTWFAHFTWLSLVMMIASTFIMMSWNQGGFSDVTSIGWFNRLAVLIYCAWLVLTASAVVRIFMRKESYSRVKI
ncbi:DUF998 domain-containing protein [Flavihumibacter solisilvae]|uniref:DUF998 domain-containing protein n=1 Tax=Flavihumibacter solisilvae TaxID=1349421 RepID=A0A0C1L0P7_9BACT|nr:DUF998 domain-containing protein [Flavihumibacter solisilvae]KIC93577.1 hypothetical protein OI18_17760 [Flavihumibacter solisilvae]